MIDSQFPRSPLRVALIVLALTVSADEVVAALGQAPSIFTGTLASPQVPGARMLAVTPTALSPLYALHTVQLENGTQILEYATPAGIVFAVSWRGPVLPDLNALLGNYFNTFNRETEQARMKGRRGAPVNIELEGLVIRSNGRMRNFFGHAYAPDLIPAGVRIKDVLQ